jgi:TonB-dependent receptor
VYAAGSYSTSKHTFHDTDDGFFGSTTFNGSTLPNTGIGTGTANPQRITVNLLDRSNYITQTVKSYRFNTGDTALGQEIDWQNLKNMYIGGAVSRPAETRETVGAMRLWAKYDFHFANPLAVRVGFDYDENYRDVDQYDAKLWTFVGADHIASTADDSADQIAAVNVPPARDSYYNSPSVARISMRRLYEIYKAHPDWFQYRDAESYRFSTVDPYELDEKTHAYYLQVSGAFLQNRLTYIGGVRYEKTEAWGLGNVDNGSASTAGITDPLLAAQKRYVRKGASGQGMNDGWFPSIELNYNLADDVILRAGYAKTQAKNRYSRSVIPSSTYDFTAPTSGPYSGIAIGSVNRPNPGLQPWSADNFETHLEYYTPLGGVFSIGGFLKDIDNVQVQQTVLLDTPEKLASIDLDPSFLNFQATTWINDGVGRITGLEIELRQPLDKYLPDFARGLTFTGSFNRNRLTKFNALSNPNGNIGTDFQNFYDEQIKASFAYQRGRFGANVGWIYYGTVYRQRENVTTGTDSIRGDRFYPPYSTVDFSLSFRIARWAELFVSGNNITNAQKLRQRVVMGAPDWSHFQIANNLGVVYSVGVTGSF